MDLLLISLVISAIAALSQGFWGTEARKPRLILACISLVGAAVAYFVAKDDESQIVKLQADVTRSQQLLQSANQKLSAQSERIDLGFASLTAQMSIEGISSKTILNTVRNLEADVHQLTVDSKKSISAVLGFGGVQDLPGKNQEIYIPLGNRNAIAVDTKNQFAVSVDTPDERNRIGVIMNGGYRRMAPGDQIRFTDDQSKPSYLVYKGQDGEKMTFFVK